MIALQCPEMIFVGSQSDITVRPNGEKRDRLDVEKTGLDLTDLDMTDLDPTDLPDMSGQAGLGCERNCRFKQTRVCSEPL